MFISTNEKDGLITHGFELKSNKTLQESEQHMIAYTWVYLATDVVAIAEL